MINLECITPVDHICGMRASRSLTRLRAELFPTSSTSWWLKGRSEEHTSELQSHHDLVCRLLLEKKNLEDIPPLPLQAADRRGGPHRGGCPPPDPLRPRIRPRPSPEVPLLHAPASPRLPAGSAYR